MEPVKARPSGFVSEISDVNGMVRRYSARIIFELALGARYVHGRE
jgi:hypothetical protein